LVDFEHCFEVNFVAVHHFVARRLGVLLADDLAAETFATAFRRRHSFDPSLGSARAWLLGIANNLVRQHWRAEQRMLALNSRLEVEPESIGRQAGPEAQVAASGLAPRVARALASLSAEQRDVLLLHAWGGLSDEEVAVALGLPAGTVRSRLWRARGALRSQLLGAAGDLDVPEPDASGVPHGLAAQDDLPRGK
jgi:RNA polymerase sigma factor (sigma-70 family)